VRRVALLGVLLWSASLWLALALDAATAPPLRPSAEPFVADFHWCFRSAMIGRACEFVPVEV
jgi:hypothetical protein